MHVFFSDRRRHHAGKLIGCAGEGGNTQPSQLAGELLIVGGRPLVVEGQQGDELDMLKW